MLTRLAAAALAITFLGASAYGLTPVEPAEGPATKQASGMTVIEKNSAWPLKDRMSMDPCMVTICQEA